MRTRAPRSSTCLPTATACSTPSPGKPTSASCNTPQNFGAAFIHCWKIRFVEKQLGGFTRLQGTLEKILAETQPDCVVSTYPVYGHVIQKIYRDHERPFRFITVVTDSITINSAWYRAPSDIFCVANEATAEVLRKNGVPDEAGQGARFSGEPGVCRTSLPELPPPVGEEPRRVLYIINTGKKKAGKAIDRLLELDNVHLTIMRRPRSRTARATD